MSATGKPPNTPYVRLCEVEREGGSEDVWEQEL